MQATERFTNRVEHYVRYRPHYPPALVECLRTNCRLTEASVIADVGSGTGILTRMFLQNGNLVYGVEPNREMREAGERFLQGYHLFRSIAGTAEETTLAPDSIDFVTAGQAFHWFDRDRARMEFKRILKPQGWIVLVWNRRLETTPFGEEYERLLRTYGTDYAEVNHKRVDEKVLVSFFGGAFKRETFPNNHYLDFEGLKGRLLSASYAPEAGHSRHGPMLAELRGVFDRHQVDNQILCEYDTDIYYGHLN